MQTIKYSSSQHSASYSLNNFVIDSTSLHQDLGILVSSDLTWDNHYSAIISKAYKSLYFIRRATSNSHSPHTKLSLYKSLTRTNILYCSQLWRLHKIKDIKLFEWVQRRASYKTTIPTIKAVWSIFTCSHSLYGLNTYRYLLPHQMPLRSSQSLQHLSVHPVLIKQHSSILWRKTKVHLSTFLNQPYFNRAVKLWNSLPIMNCSMSASTIKSLIKKFLWSHFISNFDPNNSCTWFLCCPCPSCHSKTLINFSNFHFLTACGILAYISLFWLHSALDCNPSKPALLLAIFLL